jgi:hypothetical protein
MFDNRGHRIFALIDCQIILCSGFLRVNIVVIFCSVCSMRGDGLCTTRIMKDVTSETKLKTVHFQMILLCISPIVVCVDGGREGGYGVSYTHRNNQIILTCELIRYFVTRQNFLQNALENSASPLYDKIAICGVHSI